MYSYVYRKVLRTQFNVYNNCEASWCICRYEVLFFLWSIRQHKLNTKEERCSHKLWGSEGETNKCRTRFALHNGRDATWPKQRPRPGCSGWHRVVFFWRHVYSCPNTVRISCTHFFKTTEGALYHGLTWFGFSSWHFTRSVLIYKHSKTCFRSYR